MSYTEQWTVTIDIAEEPGRTHAVARLTTRDAGALTGTGEARRHPGDREVPEIGAELAVARALADLQHRLFETAVLDIERSTGATSHLTG
ncbi:DUF1876 domain-containing protein [Pseudonocardia spirodelae]|uniref:DUF1876 domain-containing protein n=1 Tax=Pseudonocardia spirodelae TaxID=3133431 RepID=A0ABU8T2J1_9PSEU